MQVLISDTNIWIDLHRGGLLDAAFSLPYRFVRTEFVVTELQQPTALKLREKGLTVIALNSKAMSGLYDLMQTLGNSSLADVSCYYLAQQNPEWRLLTNDSHVRKTARQAGFHCNGILWLLDELYAAFPKAGKTLASALRTMLVRGAYLPDDECHKRLAQWNSWKKKASVRPSNPIVDQAPLSLRSISLLSNSFLIICAFLSGSEYLYSLLAVRYSRIANDERPLENT